MKLNSRYIFFSLLLYVIGIPVFEHYLGPIGNILVNAVACGISILMIMIMNQKVYFYYINDKKMRIFSYAFLIYFVLIAISILHGVIFLGVNPILRDIFEFHKPILYISVFIFTYSIFIDDENFHKFKDYLFIAFALIFFIACFQIFENRSVTLFYTANNIYESGRLTIPFGNPYDFAFVILFFCFYFFTKFLSGSYSALVLFAISLLLLLETGSRSVFISFITVFLLFLPMIFIFSYYSIKTKVISFFKIFIILALAISIIDFQKFYENYIFLFEQFFQLYESGSIGDSAGARLEQFLFVYERSLQNPLALILGNGPAKSLIGYTLDDNILYMEHVESLFTYILYRYGILGAVCFAYIYFSALITAIQNLRYKPADTKMSQSIYHFNISSLLWFLSIPFSAFGGMYIEQPKVSFFFYMIIAFCYVVNFKLLKNNA